MAEEDTPVGGSDLGEPVRRQEGQAPDAGLEEAATFPGAPPVITITLRQRVLPRTETQTVTCPVPWNV